ncbi:hypothetical protein ABZ249_18365 [Nocardiopsis sp. NPDC006139]|uniref:hypothetical protein n=1 Tax=Nocardiopsis TaxID=2013 RepID=UPI0033AFBCD4
MNAASIVSWVLFVAVFALARALTREPYADLLGSGIPASLASFGTAAALGLLVLFAVQRFAARSRRE